MNSFQIIVLSIFVILAILILTSFAILLNSKKDEDSEYPTTYNTCPDYWTVDTSDSKKCKYSAINTGNIALISTNTPSAMHDSTNKTVKFDETDGAWTTRTTELGVPYRCALKKWATDSNVVWDGITNYNSAYC
jgi:hypothetical protein